ncbi:Lipase 1 [Talaromyces pinophilus]|nr:Lipase 1 [Talaromyces pinophilus]
MGSIAAPNLFTFTHGALGDIKGRQRHGDIVQFRGLPFASIPARFRQSVLKEHLPNQPFDATNPGTVCPTPPLEHIRWWDGPLPDDYPVFDEPVADELHCLNLNLTIPRFALEKTKESLPVFVFIHGGAFVGGSQALQCNGREMFDLHDLVRRSMYTGKPFIGVTINYRVGPFGFLASKELAAFNKSHGEAVGNYGLHDQVRAIEWVSRFIGGFGGDPARITIQGTSAGSASCHYLSFFPNRLFSRVILASGVLPSIGPLDMESHQTLYDRIVASLDEDSARVVTSSLDRLKQAPVTDLTHKLEFDVFHPLIDREYILDKTISGASRGEEVLPTLFGASAYEDDIALFLLSDMKTRQPKSDREIFSKIRDFLSYNGMLRSPETFPFDQPAVLDAYGLTDTVNSPSGDLSGWSKLLGQCVFNISNVHSALFTSQSLPGGEGKVWLYHHAVGNLYSGCHVPGVAHHGVNDPVLFNVAPDTIEEASRESWMASVRQTQDAWITFINGESPWDPLRSGTSVRDGEEAGPIYVFRDGGLGAQYDNLHGGLGPVTARRYAGVLAASLGFEST